MKKIQKIINKLSLNRKIAVLKLIEQIFSDYKKIPSLIPLRGRRGWFRVRVGKYRIIFSDTEDGIEIESISKRDERTYKDI